MNFIEKRLSIKNKPYKNETMKNGIVVCNKCGKPTRTEINGLYFRVPCECKEKKYIAEETSILENYNLLKKPQYKDVSFFNTKIANTELETACKILKKQSMNNKGVYLYGDTGVGKTHLMVCLARQLNDMIVIKLGTLLELVRSSYNGKNIIEHKLLDDVYNIPYLALDDLGTESFIKNGGDNFNQRILYNIVENRCLDKKPTFYTSNYSLSDLYTKRGVEQRTIDRIAGSCEFIKLSGESYRIK